jgi:DNA repair exonuclease SbcCD nuclease subunit
MKILMVADLHFGVRAENLAVDSYFEQVFKNWFFPLVDREKPDLIMDLGDVFDRRKFINFQILHNCRRYYFDEIAARNLGYIVTVGNHDTYFKNTNDVNALDLVLKDYGGVVVYREPEHMTIDGRRFLLFPWIPSGDHTKWDHALASTNADIVVGHLDVAGVDTGHGVIDDGAYGPSAFDQFRLVLSGHIHKRHKYKNINYLGTMCDLVWPDYNVMKGVHTLDTETLDIKFHPNPLKLHHRLVYSDRDGEIAPSVSNVKGRFVQVIVDHKEDGAAFSKWMDNLEAAGPASIFVREMLPAAITSYGDLEENRMDDTPSILRKAATAFPEGKREAIENTLLSLYDKANEIAVEA